MPHVLNSSFVRELDERGLALVVGPRSSGLTYWSRTVPFVHTSTGSIHCIDMRTSSDLTSLTRRIQEALSLGICPTRPADLQRALASGVHGSVRQQFIVVNNAHLASEDSLEWIFTVALEPIVSVREFGVTFLVEGAIDPDKALEKVFPNGLPKVPSIQYCEPSTPWRSMVEVEEFFRARGSRDRALMIPWLIDLTGCDFGLMTELLDRIPSSGNLDDSTLLAAYKAVLRNGARVGEIQRDAERLAGDSFLGKLVTGKAIRGDHPSLETRGELKGLYFAGVVVYDVLLKAYRVKSPMAAEAVGMRLKNVPIRRLSSSDSIHARTAYLIGHIANIELQLRSVLSECAFMELAEKTNTPTLANGIAKRVKDELSTKYDFTDKQLQSVSEVLKGVLPEKQTLLSAARGRTAKDSASIEKSTPQNELMDRFTFVELVRLAQQAKITNETHTRILELIADCRNDIAHFRGASYEKGRRVMEGIPDLLAPLTTDTGDWH